MLDMVPSNLCFNQNKTDLFKIKYQSILDNKSESKEKHKISRTYQKPKMNKFYAILLTHSHTLVHHYIYQPLTKF
jgi:hypothetical protein